MMSYKLCYIYKGYTDWPCSIVMQVKSLGYQVQNVEINKNISLWQHCI